MTGSRWESIGSTGSVYSDFGWCWLGCQGLDVGVGSYPGGAVRFARWFGSDWPAHGLERGVSG